MKNLLVKILFVVVGLVIGSCSQSEIEEQVLKPSVEQVQMEELIQYVEDIKPYVPAPLDVHTRGFWSSFRSWFKNLGKADAGGYRWGRDNGMNFWRGLRVSLTTSLYPICLSFVSIIDDKAESLILLLRVGFSRQSS
jgi:hypothetical protein